MKNIYPSQYIQIIDNLLGEDASLFWDSQFNHPPTAGLRVNPLKTSLMDLQKSLPEIIQTLPWSPEGVTLQKDLALGKHPYHKAGLFYIQEPSAMVPVIVLDPQPGERVLDLCAAPGGKTTQIQSLMGNRGLLIANDSNPKRVESLIRNLDRWGARNTAILCETPRRISEHLGEYFDRVLVDAPCSGEGTFRSDPSEIKKWSPEFISRCCRIQDEILWFAAKMVRPGGVLVYSTCTFNADENEGTIARFLKTNPDFQIDPIKRMDGFSEGIQLASSSDLDFSGTVRIWPHKTRGEGHFTARLRKTQSSPSNPPRHIQEHIPLNLEELKIYSEFFEKTLNQTPNTIQILPGSSGVNRFGNRLYWVQEGMPTLAGLNVRHWGWWLGSIQSGKWMPSPALASSLIPEDAQIVLEFSLEDPYLSTYLRGSPLSRPDLERLPDGWVLVTCSGYSLGWGAVNRGRLKSYLPRWLRTN